MEYKRIDASQIDSLWELQRQYKAEIGEDAPEDAAKERLARAIGEGRILFYGAWDGDSLVGCCSVTVGFSTFDYLPSGVFEDFFLSARLPAQGNRPAAGAICLSVQRRKLYERRLRGLRYADVSGTRVFHSPWESACIRVSGAVFSSYTESGSAALQLSRIFVIFPLFLRRCPSSWEGCPSWRGLCASPLPEAPPPGRR